ncbi:MAG: efflux transporter outer membrane subunit [Simkaniaceae bacterium]
MTTSCTKFADKNREACILEPVKINTSTDSAFSEGEWVSQNWWELFNDEKLSSLMEEAINENPTLLSAQAKMRRLFEEAGVQKAPLYPHLQFDTFDNYAHISKESLDRFPPSLVPAVINQVDLSLNFQWEIDFFGRLRHTYKAALDLAFATQAESALTKLMITTFLASTYLDLKWQLIEKALIEELIATRRQYLSLTQLLFIQGQVDKMQVDQALITLNQYRKEILEVEKQIALSRHRIGVLIGQGPESVLSLSDITAEFIEPFPLPNDLSSGLLVRRPDIAARLYLIERSAEEISAAKAAFYPNVNLLAFAGVETLSLSKLFSIESFKGALNPLLSLPIFTGGRLKSNLRAKVAAFDEAIFNYNELILNAASEVAGNISILSKVTDELEVEAISLEKSENEERLYELRLLHGIGSQLPFLLAKEKKLKESLKFNQLDYMRLTAIVKLIKSLGGGYAAG